MLLDNVQLHLFVVLANELGHLDEVVQPPNSRKSTRCGLDEPTAEALAEIPVVQEAEYAQDIGGSKTLLSLGDFCFKLTAVLKGDVLHVDRVHGITPYLQWSLERDSLVWTNADLYLSLERCGSLHSRTTRQRLSSDAFKIDSETAPSTKL